MKKKKRLSFEEDKALAHNPFSKLGHLVSNPSPERSSQDNQIDDTPSQGSLLIQEEKRARGKWVTCVYHLVSDDKAHLKALKTKLGTGGSLGEKNQLEIQGRKLKEVVAYFTQKGIQVRGFPKN